ncbi:hypothetical protein FRC04_004637 [Tulasnella sp. 424]|nr:hypothetical protein FRC04_004637 [Tulasnella sp. 424]KAG8963940.1 hypothetical protein FRC05_004342 [Tulasnella sp. 425]
MATEARLDDQLRHSSGKTINDVLPPEILAEIFNAAIFDTWEPAYKTMTNLSLVCRSWKEAGRGLELSKVLINGSESLIEQMDALLEHIHTTPIFQESNRAVIRRLSVRAGYQQDFHRLPELLGLCRTSLRGLKLDGFFTGVPAAELLQDAKPEDRSTPYFPNLTFLDLAKFSTEKFIVFITSVDSMKLEHLSLRDTFLRDDFIVPDELANLRLPRLKRVTVSGHFGPVNPTVGWLCQIAPNLQLLELHTIRQRLPAMTEFFAADRIHKSLKEPRILIKIDKSDHLDPESPDLAPLVQLIKERGWKQWICVYMNRGSRVYE